MGTSVKVFVLNLMQKNYTYQILALLEKLGIKNVLEKCGISTLASKQ